MIYANYAATTPTLSEIVRREVHSYLDGLHLNSGRNFEGIDEQTIALRARRAVARLFGVDNPFRVIFSSGATASLNMALHGLLRQGDHVITTSIEHNATARPLQALQQSGFIELDILQCDPDGSLSIEKLPPLIKSNTRLLVMTHASNVLGTILPVNECFALAKDHSILTVLDMAQTAGVLPYTVSEQCDIAAFPGHKGLGALAGIGGFVVSESASRVMKPWLSGGTGSASHSLDMPDCLPDKFEPGTQNTIGILSLAASVEEILGIGVARIRERERAHLAHFLAGLRGLKKIVPYGTLDPARSVAVVSLTISGCDAGEVSQRLFADHGIVTRSGLHCSPLAHKTAGTFPIGSIRFSFGRDTSETEIDVILEVLCGN